MKTFNCLLILTFLIFNSCDNQVLETKEKEQELRWETISIPEFQYEDNRPAALAINSKNDIFVGTYSGLVLRRFSQDTVWIPVTDLGFEHLISFIFINGEDKIFAGTRMFGTFWNNSIGYSEDNGKTWQNIFNGIRQTHAFAKFDKYYFSAGYWGVSVSEDSGHTWSKIDNGIEDKVIDAMAVDQVNGNIFISIKGSIFRSTDTGTTWLDNQISGHSLFSSVNGYIFSGSNGLYRSSDHGESWQIQNGMEEFFVEQFASNSKNWILVGTYNNGLYVTKDFGDSWNYLGLNGNRIYSLTFDNDDIIYVGTDSLGLIKSNIPLH